MVRGEADLALPQLDCSRRQGGGSRPSHRPLPNEEERRREEGGGPPGLQVSAYARLTLARLVSQVRRAKGNQGRRVHHTS